jgi:hypothetical protein
MAVKIQNVFRKSRTPETDWAEEGVFKIEVGWWAAGFLIKPIRVGMPIQLLRIVRTGVVALGRFESSVVRSIEPPFVHTKNSLYQISLVRGIQVKTDEDQTDGKPG